ncbi:STAS domain-containing protein [Teredinibacter waterburyi]|jgi:STAS domain.|uniref:STAS domain-containing protein n=1 Tax=Teredinibacter waterburyi TaxID=1500538 RepID=UPI00165FF76A|nr:STAS domain-containing protein [Teredinibacter waterburyi]
MTSRIDFRLPENMTIATINSLHEQFEALVDKTDCDAVVLQGDAVARADTAGIQLLVAFIHASRERKIAITWDHPSEKLCSAAALLGLDKTIGIH